MEEKWSDYHKETNKNKERYDKADGRYKAKVINITKNCIQTFLWFFSPKQKNKRTSRCFKYIRHFIVIMGQEMVVWPT